MTLNKSHYLKGAETIHVCCRVLRSLDRMGLVDRETNLIDAEGES